MNAGLAGSKDSGSVGAPDAGLSSVTAEQRNASVAGWRAVRAVVVALFIVNAVGLVLSSDQPLGRNPEAGIRATGGCPEWRDELCRLVTP